VGDRRRSVALDVRSRHGQKKVSAVVNAGRSWGSTRVTYACQRPGQGRWTRGNVQSNPATQQPSYPATKDPTLEPTHPRRASCPYTLSCHFLANAVPLSGRRSIPPPLPRWQLAQSTTQTAGEINSSGHGTMRRRDYSTSANPVPPTAEPSAICCL
jgi:hypothetical protein